MDPDRMCEDSLYLFGSNVFAVKRNSDGLRIHVQHNIQVLRRALPPLVATRGMQLFGSIIDLA